FVIEAMAVHDENTGEIVEAHPERQLAGLDHSFSRSQHRDRDVGVVETPHVRPRLKTGRRIEIMRDLKVVDVNVDRVLVFIVVDEAPPLDRAEPLLDQGNVGKRGSVERIDKSFGVVLAGKGVEKPAGDHQVSLKVRRYLRDIYERGVGV